MTLQRLSNERWGFSSNCFVCEPTNSAGLRQPFFHDTDTDMVVADLELGPEHSGAPTYVHGGVQLALLDEAMAWAAIAVAERFAVTATFRSEFHHPIRVGKRYRLEATIGERSDTSAGGDLAHRRRPGPRAHLGSCHLGRALGGPGRRRRRLHRRDHAGLRPPVSGESSSERTIITVLSLIGVPGGDRFNKASA